MAFLPALAAFFAANSAWITPVAAIAGAGTSIGLGINSSIDNSNFQKQQLANQQAALKNNPTSPAVPTGPSQSELQSAIGQTANDLVSNTSGLASPDYYATLAPIFSGAAGQTNTNSAVSNVLKSLFGGPTSENKQQFTPAGTTPNPVSGPINLSDFIYQLGGSGA